MRKFNATRSAGGFILVKDAFKLCEKRKLQFESDCQMGCLFKQCNKYCSVNIPSQ
jgi:hypothetical protein